ncbi:MAG: cysteine synthase family protein [Cyclobacteriaceae bacterium]
MIEAIGNTPLIKLQRLTGPDSADVYVKFEGGNPTGSMKDRMALAMIEGAENRGDLQTGFTVVEYTGGSTGSSLAMVCAAKGYKTHFVSSDAFAMEKLQTMRAFGAELELIKSDGGMLTGELIDRMIARTKELSVEPDTFWPDQVNNPDNKKAYHKMAKEIIGESGPVVDEFITAEGGGGCFSGNSEIFKEQIPGIRCIAVEPYHVRNISGGDTSGKHRLEGIGLSFIPSIFRADLVDEVISVSDQDAFETARNLALTEGVFGGITSGANVWAAIQRAKILGPGKKIVTVVIDSGLRYLDGDLYSLNQSVSDLSKQPR